MSSSIYPQDELYELLSAQHVTDFLLRGEYILYVRRGKEYLYSHSLFSPRVSIPETEEWLIREFGKVRSLSSLAIDSMVSLSPNVRGGHYAWHLLGKKEVYASCLPMHTREYATPGEYEGMLLFDRKSAHLACASGMLFPLPYSLRIFPHPSPRKFEFSLEREGCSRVKCIVHKPSKVQGVLSIESKDGIVYPNKEKETFWGTYTHNELRYALANGVDIIDVEWTMSAMHSHRYLAPFAKNAMRLRRDALTGRERVLAKLLGNRLFGRLGIKGGETTMYKPGKKGEGLFFAGKHWQEKKAPTPKSNRLWGSMVFAEQRCAMHAVLERSVSPVYAHTDSVICKEFGGGMEGESIGEWEQQQEGDCTVQGMGQYRLGTRGAYRGMPGMGCV